MKPLHQIPQEKSMWQIPEDLQQVATFWYDINGSTFPIAANFNQDGTLESVSYMALTENRPAPEQYDTLPQRSRMNEYRDWLQSEIEYRDEHPEDRQWGRELSFQPEYILIYSNGELIHDR